MDTDGVAFRNRAYHAEEIMELTIAFIQSKDLYDEYMEWKTTQKPPTPIQTQLNCVDQSGSDSK